MDAQTIAAFVFGSVFVIAMLAIALVITFRKNPTDIPPFAMLIFRVVLALAAAGVAATLPGFLEIESKVAEFGLRAGGALAVFVLIYWTNPPVIAQARAAKTASKTGNQSDGNPGPQGVARVPVPGPEPSGSLVTQEESVAPPPSTAGVPQEPRTPVDPSPPAKLSNVLVTFELDLDDLDPAKRRLLTYGLAGFLGVAPAQVRIVSVERGSIKVTIEIPLHAAERLIAAALRGETELARAIAPLVITGVSHADGAASVRSNMVEAARAGTPNPSVFISYSHDSSQHQARVLALSNRLRADGLDCNIDQYEVSPNQGWPRWMSRQIKEADFVLVVCTETYLRRFNGDEAPGVGQGVRWESMLTIQDIYDRASLNAKFIPVVFESTDSQFIPTSLRGVTRLHLDAESGYRQLLRRLLNIPPAARPPLGKRVPVESRQRQREFFTAHPEVEIALAKLPSTSSDLFGRDEQLAALDEAWEDTKTSVVTLVAFGGVGKSALVNVWLGRMREDGFRGARRVYGWSFYSQGTSEDRQASGDEFLSATLKWFGEEEKDIPKSAWDRGERLAQLCRENRTLLILDGLEPLQHPPGEQTGKLRDPGVQSLLRELAVDNRGLCVVSTRIAVDDLKGFEGTSVRRVDLDDLSPEAGGRLLAKLGVDGPDDELEQAATDFGGHALALTLLGRYLAVVHDGDVRKRNEVPPLTVAAKDGAHAKRVMECYERWFEAKPELCILRMLGLFDRPAEGGAIEALRTDPPIEHLTDALTGVSKPDWKFALKNLRDARLLADADPGAPDTLDCHPHVREHFGARLSEHHGPASRAGHDRLFEYFRGPGCAKELPDTIQEMAPLFAAVLHGCRAGRHQEALDEVYFARIQRGNQAFAVKTLGAFGADLASLAGFFEHPWVQTVSGITHGDKSYALFEAGFRLRALGRLREAGKPIRAALQHDVAAKRWQAAATATGNLSELHLTLGDTAEALTHAEQSVELGDRSRDPFERMRQRTKFANALLQVGRMSESEQGFREAERMQKAMQEFPILYSQRGFQFCDLLLDLGRPGEVTERATQTLAWVTRKNWLLDIALDHLSLGRAALMRVQEEGGSDFTEAQRHLSQAVDGLREAGTQDHMPRGFLARAELYRATEDFPKAQRDLDEAMKIATRSGMRLHEADAHLEYARLHLAMADKDKARASLAAGKAIVEDTGYHRRDGAVKELEQQLA